MQPLPSANLLDAAVPEWADIFLRRIPFGTRLLDLADAASVLRLDMLVSLCCAKIASKIKQGICSDILNAEARYSCEDEAKLKAQNEWAWKDPVADVVSHEEDQDLESEVTTTVTTEAGVDDVSASVDDAIDPAIETDAFFTAGLMAIIKDVRLCSQNTTDEPLRLLSPLAGKIALFL